MPLNNTIKAKTISYIIYSALQNSTVVWTATWNIYKSVAET